MLIALAQGGPEKAEEFIELAKEEQKIFRERAYRQDDQKILYN